MRRAREWMKWLLFPVLLLGCQEAPPPAAPSDEAPVEIGRHFHAAGAGTIEGHVLWSGPVPDVPPFVVPPIQFGLAGPHDRLRWANPNVPVVDPTTRGVADVVVFLRGVDPARSRPWDHPAVEVEQRDFRLQVRQGTAVSRVGFVRRGDTITAVSRQNVFHALHGDGAAFFNLPFPDADRPSTRRLKERGLVELWSAANYYWMRAYLFVDDHPYYTRTNREGRFVLPAVPPGNFEVVCWIPNWLKDRHHRDPESAVIIRHFFRPPVERAQGIAMRRGESCTVEFTLSTTDFAR